MFQHVWIILLPPNWTELSRSQIWSKKLKPVILSSGCLQKGGILTVKGAKERQNPFSTGLHVIYGVLTPLAISVYGPTSRLSRKIPGLKLIVLRRPRAVTWSGGWAGGGGLAWFRSHLLSKSPCCPSPPVLLHSNVVCAEQTGLLCLKPGAPNRLWLPVGGFSAHSQVQLVWHPQNNNDVNTGILTPCISYHSALQSITARASRAVPPSFALLLGGGEQLAGHRASLPGLLGTAAVPSRWGERQEGRQPSPDRFQRSCFQLGRGTAESFSCRMSYGCV